MNDAMARGARGGAITIAGQSLKLLIHLAALVVLSRLLAPEDFGLIAMVVAFVALGELIRDFGTSVVGLGRRELSPQQATNLFWLSTCLGLIAAVALTLATPLLVSLYREPRLTLIVPMLAISVLVNALSAQFTVQMARNMRYPRILMADVGAPAAGLAAAITGAVLGWEYWALIAQTLATAVVGLLMRVGLSGWWPGLPRREVQNRRLLTDSATFGLAQLIQYISQNLDTVLIGVRWDALAVGPYDRAFQLLKLPVNQMMAPLTQVVIPTVNRAVAQGRSSHEVLLKVQFGLGLILEWLFAITAGIAPWLIPFVLGEEWVAVVPLYQILAIGGAVWIFSTVNYWVVIVGNHGRILLGINIVTKLMTSIFIFIAAFHSIEAIAWAVSIGLVITWPIALLWLSKFAGQPGKDYFKNGLLLLVAAGAAFLGSNGAFSAVVLLAPGLAPTIGIFAGTVCYLVALSVFPAGRQNLRMAAALARRLLPK